MDEHPACYNQKIGQAPELKAKMTLPIDRAGVFCDAAFETIYKRRAKPSQILEKIDKFTSGS